MNFISGNEKKKKTAVPEADGLELTVNNETVLSRCCEFAS